MTDGENFAIYSLMGRKRRARVTLDSDSDDSDASAARRESSKRRKESCDSVSSEPPLTPQQLAKKLEAEKKREQQKKDDEEIHNRLAQDSVLQRTQEVIRAMNAVEESTIGRRIDYNDEDVIVLDDDDENEDESDSDVEILEVETGIAHVGKEINVRLRINGNGIETMTVWDQDPLEYLLVNYCNKNNLKREAVRMIVDGAPIATGSTARDECIDQDVLIDACVDFLMKQTKPLTPLQSSKKARRRPSAYSRQVTLQLKINGKRPEPFRVNETGPLAVLFSAIAERQGIYAEQIRMEFDTEPIDPTHNAMFYGLHEDSVLDVTIDTPDDTPPVCVIHGSEINIDGEMVDVFVSKAGLEAEKYRIESRLPISKLFEKFCARHRLPILNTTFKLRNETVREYEFVEVIDFGVNDVIIAETEDANEEEKEEVIQDAVSVFLQVEGKARDKFKISPSATVLKLIAAYARKNNLVPAKVVLKIDGEKMTPSQTLEAYDIEGEELIDVILLPGAEASPSEAPSPAGKNMTVFIQSSKHKPEKYKVPVTAVVSKLIDAYSGRHELDSEKVVLKIDGEAMNRKSTLETYDLEGEEVLDAHF